MILDTELKFKFEKKVTTEALDKSLRVTLQALDDDENKFTLTASFENLYPEMWKKILGQTRGDFVTVRFISANQQTELEE